jgi:hypothetical protein
MNKKTFSKKPKNVGSWWNSQKSVMIILKKRTTKYRKTNKLQFLSLKFLHACLTFEGKEGKELTNWMFCPTVSYNRTAHIRHLCQKTTVLSCHRYLINTGVEKMNYI